MIVNKEPLTLQFIDGISGVTVDYILNPIFDKGLIDIINKYSIPVGFMPHEYILGILNFNLEWEKQWREGIKNENI